MNTAFRRIVVSGSAAVAVLGGAAAVTAASAPAAHAAEAHTATNAITAPVRLPDGRTLRVVGMGGYGHQASPAHTATIASFASDQDPADITTGVTPNGGSGAALTNPQQQAPAGINQQVNTQAGGGFVAVGVVAILVLGVIVFFKIRSNHIKAGDAILVCLFGISLAGTIVGTMGNQITNSLIGSLGGVLGGL